jgi:hypothetical protein
MRFAPLQRLPAHGSGHEGRGCRFPTACAFRLSQPPDASIRHVPAGLVSCRIRSWGCALQSFAPPAWPYAVSGAVPLLSLDVPAVPASPMSQRRAPNPNAETPEPVVQRRAPSAESRCRNTAAHRSTPDGSPELRLAPPKRRNPSSDTRTPHPAPRCRSNGTRSATPDRHPIPKPAAEAPNPFLGPPLQRPTRKPAAETPSPSSGAAGTEHRVPDAETPRPHRSAGPPSPPPKRRPRPPAPSNGSTMPKHRGPAFREPNSPGLTSPWKHPRLQGFAPRESPPLPANWLGRRRRVALLGFIPSRVFPLATMARPSPGLPSWAFSHQTQAADEPTLQGFICRQMGWSLSRLPTLLGFPAS